MEGTSSPATTSKATLPPAMEQKSEPATPWESICDEELMESDFSIYDDLDYPYLFRCSRFTYRNKAQIKKDEQIAVSISRNLTVFDAIGTPHIAGLLGGVGPIDITVDCRLRLTPLCKLALDKYNAENQGANFVFAGLVKSTYSSCSGGMYYMTFQANDATHPSNSTAITFQAQVWNRLRGDGPPVVMSCAMKFT